MDTKPIIVLAGGSGFLGQLLIEQLGYKYNFIVLGRKTQQATQAHYIQYPHDPEALVPLLNESKALINLAGKSVNCRYTEANKKAIRDSRVETTAYLGKAIELCEEGPEVWMNMSSATIYPHSMHPQYEYSSIQESNFSVEVCKAWEKTFHQAATPAIRKIILRTGLVLDNDGGAFEMFRKLGRFGLAGTMGPGSQFINWIHADDFVNSIDHLLNHRSMGIYNLCAPQPEPNASFLAQMRKYFHMPLALKQPKWLLDFGAVLLGTSSELVLKSRCVIPQRLLNEGYEFKYQDAAAALEALALDHFQSAEKSSRSAKTGNFSLPSFKASADNSA